ncbi:amidase [Bradyrhizobium sp. BWA-3-5]|uniref:amidase n=1 Tax=Bradyrhizobium sp. BWA-3-5 TaxID=3080013 RepID=UPI00293F5284|nr:amidase [Bradyrhizobium sp. BWA-3-5]WOH63714.1 amidase [Bradyrhizobium sp. BWA-3-5]
MKTDQTTDVAFSTAADIGRALASGKLTSVEVVATLIDRIAKYDTSLNSFIEVFEKEARSAALDADKRREQGASKGPLDGVPIAVKDLFDVAGYPTGAGSRAIAAQPATTSASAVKRVVDQGMIVLGKTHTVEFAFGGWGTNPVCGTPVNPRDRTTPRVPGGSSSGSGVAVAAGLVPVALGTDTGGSVRNPSALCGIIGLKTSLGLVGRAGVWPLAMSFDTVGPMARSVEDVALLHAALQGYDPDDPTTFGLKPINPMVSLERGISGLTFRVPSSKDLEDVAPAILSDFRAVLLELEKLGATIDEKSMPRPLKEYAALGSNIITTEAWHHLRRYAEPSDSVVDPLIRSRLSRGREFDADKYLNLMDQRRLVQSEFNRYLNGADAFLNPTSPITAPPIQGAHETIAPMGICTRFVSLMDMAALSIPIGLVEGLPTALQIVVRRFDDHMALRIGRALEIQRQGLFVPPTGY